MTTPRDASGRNHPPCTEDPRNPGNPCHDGNPSCDGGITGSAHGDDETAGSAVPLSAHDANASGATTISRRGRPSLEEAQRMPARILEAGWDMLREHGFEAFTFDRVARHAHIGKATIYTRFASKREFLEALLAHKMAERKIRILGIGSGMPPEEAFCQRAVAVMEVLNSPDGVMMERLVDWCDQEFGENQECFRQAMYADAIENVSAELAEIAGEHGLFVADPELAARFWIEGLLGHARMAGPEPFRRSDETERWARAYSDFFFAGLRNSASLNQSDVSQQN